ncbi:uncharacterized protein T551_02804 [Pneumocystis jirovecii RU7]|uniref:Protein BIG1 n=1 Tax=Pneumocystis jirovecii (strain RU7) TaxID=1408657 RepID=A0A0W4ZHJ4_PNEJ7|nr:uncharacterized protein T551_02804 [Pneumocystis jirovecii RU7]KTW27837.1 hypothetical protein T551_02804 [Pneumocystis jirovecii RU7]
MLVLLISLRSTICFEDTSPLIFFTTYKTQPEPIYPDYVSTTLSGHAFQSFVRSSIDCKSTFYIIALQPGLHAEDLKHDAMPSMKMSLNKAEEKLVIPYGYGGMDLDDVMEYIVEKCNADRILIDAQSGSYPLLDGSGKKVLYVQFPPLKGPIMERWDLLKHHDVFLHYLLSSFPYGSEYTMIYVSTPGLTMAQHRDISTDMPPVVPLKYNPKQSKGLFSKYEFFSEGVYMIWMVLLILFPILVIALMAISSIKISYGAFELKKDVIKKNK